MNCFECAHELLLDPYIATDKVTQHVQKCSACQRLAKELKDCESTLIESLDIAYPPDLDKKLMSLYAHKAKLKAKRVIFSAAAAVLGVTIFMASYTYQTLYCPTGSALVLAHAIEELGVLNIDNELDYDRLAFELKDYGLVIRQNLGQARWIGRCDVEGGRGLHIVLDTEKYGVLTLMVLPDQETKNIEVVEKQGMFAWITTIDNVQVGVATQNLKLRNDINGFLATSLQSLSNDTAPPQISNYFRPVNLVVL